MHLRSSSSRQPADRSGKAKKRRTSSPVAPETQRAEERQSQTAVVEALFININALPADLLTPIFDFLQPNQRLDGASLVCKRWRAVVLRSFSSFRLIYGCIREPASLIRQALTLFPSLTDLTLRVRCVHEGAIYHPFDSDEHLITLPSSLRRLTIKTSFGADDWSQPYALRIALPIPPLLTHFECGVFCSSFDVQRQAVLLAARRTLTSLHLRLALEQRDNSETWPLLDLLYLPRLTEFSFQLKRVPSWEKLPEQPQVHLSRFILRHSSQLTSLSMQWHLDVCHCGKWRDGIYPELRRLALHELDEAEMLAMLPLIERCPRLTSVDMDAVKELPSDFPALHCITSLSCWHFYPSYETLTSLPSLRMLTRIFVGSGDHMKDQIEFLRTVASAGYAAQVYELYMYRDETIPFVDVLKASIMLLPNLTSLTIKDEPFEREEFDFGTLPPLRHLRKLRFVNLYLTSNKALLNFIVPIVQACPRLVKLDIDIAMGQFTLPFINSLGAALGPGTTIERVRIESTCAPKRLPKRSRLLPGSATRLIIDTQIAHGDPIVDRSDMS